MQDFPTDPVTRRRILSAAIAIAIGMVVLRALVLGRTLESVFAGSGNDEIMRLMSVRHLLEGQGWFDMTQYRLLPPDGVSLHWSRYVDLGIAAVVWLMALVLPMPMAEHLAAVFWPGLLSVGLILIVALGTRRILGDIAAAAAVLALMLWPVTSQIYFGPGKLDHHNVQIILMALACFAITWPGPARRYGAFAGVAAAVSLAVGLETLFFVAAVGIVLVVRAAFDLSEGRDRLLGFCLTLLPAALAFFVGQTAPAEWFTPYCDKLSTPFLGIAAVGSAAGLAGLALPARLRRPAPFICVVALVAGMGVVLLVPLLSPCVDGPYGALPAEIQAIISTQIVEARPALAFAASNPFDFVSFVMPAFVAVMLASIIWWRERAAMAPLQRAAVAQFISLGWIGLAACLIQIRLVIMVAPIAPVLTGFILMHLLNQRMRHATPLSGLALLGAMAGTVLLPGLSDQAGSLLKATPQGTAAKEVVQEQGCRALDRLAALNKVPAGRVLTAMNLGPRLILVTHHSGMSGPYHRSAAALANGIAPFAGDEALMRETLRTTQADYLLVCQNTQYGGRDSIGSQLAGGASVDWLDRIDLGDPDLILFAVPGG